jgi:enamine deaminase RidA (YjgF/YER057c/UK114 family)
MSSRLVSGRRQIVLLAGFLLGASAGAQAQTSGPRFINPAGLVTPTGYTHLVLAPDGQTVYIAGQVAFDSLGQVVGPGDFRAQLERVYANLRTALATVGGSLADLTKTTTYITDRSQVAMVREVRARYLDAAHPPANTLLVVAGLARPELLVEIEGVAILKQPVHP